MEQSTEGPTAHIKDKFQDNLDSLNKQLKCYYDNNLSTKNIIKKCNITNSWDTNYSHLQHSNR